MGTRGLLGFIIAGIRHASYNQYDSYPQALGKDISRFLVNLKAPEDYHKMDQLVRSIKWIDGKTPPTLKEQSYYSKIGTVDLSVSEGNLTDWYCLLRKAQGADALPLIKNGQLRHMVDSIDFLQDDIFCEWAYFIDFRRRKLETWSYSQKVGEAMFEELVEKGDAYMDNLEEEPR